MPEFTPCPGDAFPDDFPQRCPLTLPSRAGPVEILRGADLTVQAGEAIGIVGPSGSGKTTLLMVIAGLERVSSGDISVNGTVLNGQSEDDLAAFAVIPSASFSSPFT